MNWSGSDPDHLVGLKAFLEQMKDRSRARQQLLQRPGAPTTEIRWEDKRGQPSLNGAGPAPSDWTTDLCALPEGVCNKHFLGGALPTGF